MLAVAYFRGADCATLSQIEDYLNGNWPWDVSSALDCIPTQLTAEMVKASTEGWTKAQVTQVLNVVGRVILELPGHFATTSPAIHAKVEAARAGAASILANPDWGPWNDLLTVTIATNALANETSAEVAKALLNALAFNLNESMPDDVIKRGLLAIDRMATTGAIDDDTADFAAGLADQLADLHAKYLPDQPTPTPPTPTPPTPSSSTATGIPGYAKPLLLLSTLGAGILLGLAGWHVAEAVRTRGAVRSRGEF